MTGRSAEAPCSRRMRTRSTNAPAIEAPRIRTMSRAASVGWWWAETSSQYPKAAIMPTAPWAKLKTPDVV